MKTKKRYNIRPLTSQQIKTIEEETLILAENLFKEKYFVLEAKIEEEHGRWFLRIYIDHLDNTGCCVDKITLDACKEVSEALEPELETIFKNLPNFSYNLEISSPGLFRKLTKPREFLFYKDHRVEIKSKGEKAFQAYIVSYDDNCGKISYRKLPDQNSEIQYLIWDSKNIEISLSPELIAKKDIIEI